MKFVLSDMHKHDTNGTRITVERISVTTIRTRRNTQKHYCDICRAELTAAEIDAETMLLDGNTPTLELAAANTDEE
jgi:hypothetical protein